MSVSASGGLTDSSPCEPSVAPSNETRQPEAQARNTAGDPTRTSPSVPALVCKVCSSAPASPMVTMCGHVFCRGCIIAEITKNLCCPTCKHPILVEIKI
ncbi:hypothetical protein PHLGIDRAFT_20466 [Phlebiopsis gigantea 11061_1 CR5-6]|uniref:RING-type domain-containing protein n=1 Tax=Phlebiopsis gigantea (strain 11061_1 CR5-6) TaxID=745531 RepID=A0A0C3ND38_PHLG1|nr:hypothetical protein PHLGIDRAFT_20466 [Phlebiopsis gigantea 11061_1 CR5-6]